MPVPPATVSSPGPWLALRRLAWAFVMLAACALGPMAAVAGVPHEKAVPAYAEEQTILQLEQGLREPGLGDSASGIEHVDRRTLVPPGRQGEYGVILQRGGNSWRTLRNGPLAVITVALLLLTAGALVVFHLIRGPMRVPADEPAPDRPMQRFTRWQRGVHWAAAGAFVALAITGLVFSFGKNLLLPWLGHEIYAGFGMLCKWVHNITGPLFFVASVVMFATYLRHNHFRRVDLAWLGGMFSRRHVPAPYFNAGEKLWFWLGVTVLGLVMAISGLMLDFPYLGDVGAVLAYTRYQLQAANVVHFVGAALYLAMALGHIYLGTIGSPDAWRAMAHDGDVNEKWAHAHHRLWYDEVRPGRDITAARPPQPGALR